MTDISSIVSTTTSTTASTSSSTTSDATNQFLTLLMTQLTNQNPLDPLDTNEFTSQLVSYSSLEQQISMSSQLENISAMLSTYSNFSALSYLGSTVELDSSMAPVQDGTANWVYDLDSNATSATVSVTNDDGDVVYVDSVDASAGRHNLSLSLGQLNGVAEGDTLTLSVTATDGDGNSIGSSITSLAVAEALDTSSGSAVFQAGDLTFSDANIVKFYSSAAAAA